MWFMNNSLNSGMIKVYYLLTKAKEKGDRMKKRGSGGTEVGLKKRR